MVYRLQIQDELQVRTPGELSSSWAVERLQDALSQRGLRSVIRLALDESIGPETFRVERVAEDEIVVAGGDAAGVGLGCLHLVDLLRDGRPASELAGDEAVEVGSRFSIRALKVNLPWASYRQHESLFVHDGAQRDLRFWIALLDHLAESRFNLLSVWAQHPFHYMVDVPEFPEARSFPPEELLAWQDLWRSVFAAAHERGIRTYVFFWNIFVSPGMVEAHGVAPYCRTWNHIGDGDQSQIVADYNRAAVRTLIDAYEDLDGIGVAMSERMGGMTPEERGRWIEEVIVAGLNEASRPAGLCLRVPHSAGRKNHGTMDRAAESFGRSLLERVDAPGRLWTEVKFNWSHGHSTPALRKIHGGESGDAMWKPPSSRYEVTWMVRNEDFFVLRWAEPDFVREHIRLNAIPGVAGYFTGSECHIPAADYVTAPDSDARYEWGFQRHWLFYQVWGRLLHDPTTPDSRFEALIDRRYGVGVGAVLFPALKLASRVPLRIATFLNFTWDHTLYAEGLIDQQGVVTVETLIEADPVEPAWMSIREMIDGGETTGKRGVTPLELADLCDAEAEQALAAVAPLGLPSGNLGDEVADVYAWAHIGRYFAGLLRSASALARYRSGGVEAERAAAVRHAEAALAEWDRLVAVTERRYRPIPLQILGDRPYAFAALRDDVARNIDIARGG